MDVCSLNKYNRCLQALEIQRPGKGGVALRRIEVGAALIIA